MSKITVFKNIGQLMSLKGAVNRRGRRPQVSDLGLIKKAALVVEKGTDSLGWA